MNQWQLWITFSSIGEHQLNWWDCWVLISGNQILFMCYCYCYTHAVVHPSFGEHFSMLSLIWKTQSEFDINHKMASQNCDDTIFLFGGFVISFCFIELIRVGIIYSYFYFLFCFQAQKHLPNIGIVCWPRLCQEKMLSALQPRGFLFPFEKDMHSKPLSGCNLHSSRPNISLLACRYH